MKKTIYLDNAATTPVHSKVIEAVNEFFEKDYANPASIHRAGQVVNKKIIESRKIIANFFGAKDSEIIFTSGGTESNNLALRGLAKKTKEKKHIISSVFEHPAILETLQDLENSGYEIELVKVNKEGLVDPKEIEEKIREDTLVVSIMHVNNEIGTIQPIEEIAKICKEKNTYFHTDAVQSFGKIPFDISNIDLISVSGHKFNAPKGIGFLYIKTGTKISCIQTGGGQEQRMRSGTLNTPGIIGIKTALENLPDFEKIKKSRDKLLKLLMKIPGVKINGSLEKRIYHNINISFFGIEGESLMLMLSDEGIYCSTGSACASTKLSESHVLNAIGVEDLYIHGSLRLTLGNDAIGNEEFIAEKIKNAVQKLREMSPFKLEIPKTKL